MSATLSTLEILFGETGGGADRGLVRYDATDGGAYVVPIVQAIERLERRGPRHRAPRYLTMALQAYRAREPFACLTLHDAMAHYVFTEKAPKVPQYAWDALFLAEQSDDLAARDLLDYLGPGVPRRVTCRSLPADDSRAPWAIDC